jgi:transcriptional regulator of acetoin/glycerol metabolism
LTGRRVTYVPSVGEAELRDALAKCGGSVARAATYLDVHRATVYRLMARYGIELRRVPA